MSKSKYHVTQDEPHRWRNVEELVYKDEDGAATFKDVTRRILFGEDPVSYTHLRAHET